MAFHRSFRHRVKAGDAYASLVHGKHCFVILPRRAYNRMGMGLGVNTRFETGAAVNLEYQNSSGASLREQSLMFELRNHF